MSIRPSRRGLGRSGKVKLPPLREGKMTKIAQRMGYVRPTDIPDSKIPEFVDRLVDEYGDHEAIRMINVQVIFRKNHPDSDRAKRKFLLMKEYFMKRYSED